MLSEYNSENAIGSAAKEAEKSANNWTGSINKVKNSWAKLVSQVAKSDAIVKVLDYANESIQDIINSGLIGYIGDILIITTKLIKPLKTIQDTVGKYTYKPFFEGLSMIADWFNKDEIEAKKQAALIEAEKELRESALSTIEDFGKESETIEDLIGQYVNLISSTKDIASIKDSLEGIQSQIIDKYGEEAEAIDLVNGKLEDNIELLLKQEVERNKAWTTENQDAVKAANEFFAVSNRDLLSFTGHSDDATKSAAEIEAQHYYEDLKEAFEKLGIGELIQDEVMSYDYDRFDKTPSSKYRDFLFGFQLADGLTPEQQLETLEKVLQAYEELGEKYGESYNEYYDLFGGSNITGLRDLITQMEDYISILEKNEAIKSDTSILESVLGDENDLKLYTETIAKITELNKVVNDSEASPTARYSAIEQISEQENVIDSLIKKYPALENKAETALRGIGLTTAGLIADEQALYDNFIEALDNTHKEALSTIDKLETAMASAIKGEGLSHDSAWEILKLDTDNLLKPVIDSAGKYHFELEDIISLKDSIIQKNKEIVEQDLEQAKLEKTKADNALATLKIEYEMIMAKLAETSIGGKPSDSVVAQQATLKKQIDELEKSSKAYGDEIERDSILIKEYNAHMGDLSNTEKMLTAQTEALKKQQEQLKNEIDALNKEADARLKAQEAKIDSIIDGYQAEVDELEEAKDLLQEQLDTLNEQKDALQEIVDNYESIGGIVENTISKQVEELEKSRQEVEDYYNNLIDKLKQENDEREDALNYAQKLADLENAKNNKVMVYGSGTGWTYEVDQDALAKAQRALDEADNDKAIKELEKARDAAVGDYDSQIKAYEEYGDKWTDVSKAIKEGDEEVLAEEILGAEWREKITDQDIELLEKYEKEYRDYNNQLKTLTKTEIKSLEDSIKAKNKEIETKQKQVKLWKDYKSAVQDAVSNIKNQLEDYNEFLDGVALKEDSTYDERQKNLTDFANAYQSLITQIVAKNKDLDAVVSKADEVSNQLAEIAHTTLTMKVDTDDASKAMADFIDKYREAIEDMQEALNESLTGFGVVNSAWDAKLAEAARALRTGSYAEGGAIPYTGIAMVHGKPNSSETAFNASQSRDLWNMVRTGNFSSMVADRALEGVGKALGNPQSNNDNSRVININGMVIKADNPQQFHSQFMQEINKYWDVQIVDSPIR